MEPLLELFGESNGKEGEEERAASLPPEAEEGNIEYKLKLLNPSASRFEHLVTQMKWRLQEGRGEAIYEIGVADCGALKGLSERELDASLDTLCRMAQRLGATASTLRRRPVPTSSPNHDKRFVAEVLVRKVPDDQQFLDIRLAVLGSMEAGKSTLLGVLTQGELDNGRGKARLNLFRHLHEIQSGRTSSISHEIMGLTSKGEVVNYATHGTAEEICEASAKLITFIDLAGHHKYLKTTVFGLAARKPDLAMLVVGANLGVVGTTCEHLGFCIALHVPTLVVVSKVDLCSQQLVEQTVAQMEELLMSPGCKKTPRVIKSENDAYTTAQQLNEVCPIFLLSSVTGRNLDLLIKFLNTVPKQHSQEAEQEPAEFRVDEIYSVPDVGTVVGGILVRGVVREGDNLVFGPNDSCGFSPTRVTSIHRYRSCCRLVKAGQAATLALDQVDRAIIRKGTVLLDPAYIHQQGALSCWEFTADIFLLQHKGSGVKRGFQSTVYVASSMQTATIESIMEKETLVTSDEARVRFRFLKHPEFLRVGSRLLFRDGQTKGMGQVTILHDVEHPQPCR